MSFESISPAKLALIFGIGSSCNNIRIIGIISKKSFSGSITDEATVILKEGNNCIVEGADEIPEQYQIVLII